MKQANAANGELSRTSARDYKYRGISTTLLQILHGSLGTVDLL
jgi:hypothetical protein